MTSQVYTVCGFLSLAWRHWKEPLWWSNDEDLEWDRYCLCLGPLMISYSIGKDPD